MASIYEITRIALEILGLVFVCYILLRLIFKFSQKNRELSAIDRDIKTALREALQDDQTLRDRIKRNFDEKNKLISDELEQKKRDLEDSQHGLAFFSRHTDLAYYLVQVIFENSEQTVLKTWSDATERYGQFLEPLLIQYPFEAQRVQSLFAHVFTETQPDLDPAAPQYALLLHGTRQLRPVLELISAVQVYTAVLQESFDEFVSRPNDDFENILERASKKARKVKRALGPPEAWDFLAPRLQQLFQRVQAIKSKNTE